MSPAIHDSLGIVAYLALFAGVGLLFVFVNLLIGRILRPSDPHPEKLEIYECGEPAIGSSYVQFDLRFYVVALIFIIFDVEVAFLFPWATVLGKAHHLSDDKLTVVAATEDGGATLSPDATAIYRELGVSDPRLNLPRDGEARASIAASRYVKDGARTLTALATIEVLVFFVILLIGFAYVWSQGALDWVRALTSQQRANPPPHRRDASPRSGPNQPVLSS